MDPIETAAEKITKLFHSNDGVWQQFAPQVEAMIRAALPTPPADLDQLAKRLCALQTYTTNTFAEKCGNCDEEVEFVCDLSPPIERAAVVALLTTWHARVTGPVYRDLVWLKRYYNVKSHKPEENWHGRPGQKHEDCPVCRIDAALASLDGVPDA